MILYPHEIWKRVTKYTEVSSFGRKRVRGKIVELRIHPTTGYCSHAFHRLVAKAFIPNPLNLPQVHHKDGTRTNNHISNLMWVTQRENLADPIHRERLSKQIRVWNDHGYSWIFPSVREAQRILNLSASNLSWVASGKRKQTKGYYAEYI